MSYLITKRFMMFIYIRDCGKVFVGNYPVIILRSFCANWGIMDENWEWRVWADADRFSVRTESGCNEFTDEESFPFAIYIEVKMVRRR